VARRSLGSWPVSGLIDDAEVGRKCRPPVDQLLVEVQPPGLVEGDCGGDPAAAAVRGNEPALRHRSLRDDHLVGESRHPD
jgi:hypothetical protein